jgi:predicted ATPase
MLRDWRTAYSHADQAIRLAEEHGLVYMLPWTAFLRGWSLAQTGQTKEGLAQMLQCRTDMQVAGAIIQPWFFWGLVDVYLAAGRPPEGLEAVAEGLEMVERTRSGFSDAELQRLRGEYLLVGSGQASAALSEDDGAKHGPLTEAAASFRKAIEVARRQQAKSWELRATISLARLLVQQGRRAEARTILAEIYAWFTEGFHTPDLQDARALLDQLT